VRHDKGESPSRCLAKKEGGKRACLLFWQERGGEKREGKLVIYPLEVYSGGRGSCFQSIQGEKKGKGDRD